MNLTDRKTRLKSYVKPDHAHKPFGGLSRYACLIAFLHWTAKSCRDGDSVPTPSPLRCPMLWCREKFDDLGSILQHIPLCPCLEDGHYWCSECSKPERFMEKASHIESSNADDSPCPRNSRLKRASTFFKGLSHAGPATKSKAKSRRNSLLGTSSSLLTRGISSLIEKARRKHAHGGNDSSDKEALGSPITLPNYEDFVQDITKLDNLKTEDLEQLFGEFDEGETRLRADYHDSANINPAEAYLRAESSTSGLEVTSNVAPETTQPPAFIEPTAVSDMQCAELDDTSQFLPLTNYPEDLSRSVSPLPDHGSSRPISPSPISPLAIPFAKSLLSHDLSLNNEGHLAHIVAVDTLGQRLQTTEAKAAAAKLTPPTNSVRHISTNPPSEHDIEDPVTHHPQNMLMYSTPGHMVLPAVTRDSEFLENSTFQSPEARIKEVRALINVVNKEWLDRIARSPRLLSRCAGLSTSMLFEKGVSATQQCFRGNLPDTFLELFGMVHVACAVAYTFHKDDSWYHWEDLFMNMLEWQHALDRDSERQFYLEALEHLKRPKMPLDGWLKQLNPASKSSHDPMLPIIPKSITSDIHDDVFAMFTNDTLQQDLMILSRDDSLLRLRRGRILQDCETFLNGRASPQRIKIKLTQG